MVAQAESDNQLRRRRTLSRGDDIQSIQLPLFGMGEGAQGDPWKGTRQMDEGKERGPRPEGGNKEERLATDIEHTSGNKPGRITQDVPPVRKEYDPLLNKLVAQPAESAVASHLLRMDGVEKVVPFPFGEKDVDLGVLRYNEWFYVDVERRSNWRDGEVFPPYLNPLHVPYRKKSMIERRQPLIYYVVRDDI